jgi:hypothetical protein
MHHELASYFLMGHQCNYIVSVINYQDVALGGDELPKGTGHDKRKDLLIDSAISRTHYLEERELERWAPDEGDSECLELEKYDRKGNRYYYIEMFLYVQ